MLSEKEFLSAVSEHQNLVHKVCNLYAETHHDREDLFQEILLNAWKGVRNFRGEAKFTTWLYRVAINTAITFFRKEKKQPAATQQEEKIHLIADESYQPDEQLSAVYKAINKLSGIDKALVMLYLDDYNYTDIGEMLGITPNHVAVKMNRIKTKLKEEANKYYQQV